MYAATKCIVQQYNTLLNCHHEVYSYSSMIPTKVRHMATGRHQPKRRRRLRRHEEKQFSSSTKRPNVHVGRRRPERRRRLRRHDRLRARLVGRGCSLLKVAPTPTSTLLYHYTTTTAILPHCYIATLLHPPVAQLVESGAQPLEGHRPMAHHNLLGGVGRPCAVQRAELCGKKQARPH